MRDLCLPVLVAADDARAQLRFVEFFAVTIRNPHTRRAYARGADEFVRGRTHGAVSSDVRGWQHDSYQAHIPSGGWEKPYYFVGPHWTRNHFLRFNIQNLEDTVGSIIEEDVRASFLVIAPAAQ